MPRGDGRNTAERRIRKSVSLPQYVPKKLKRRLSEGVDWKVVGRTYQPPVGQEMRRPGSQNPRK